MLRTPVRAPCANAIAERWVGTVRRELLDRVLIMDRRHVEVTLTSYLVHYNEHRRTAPSAKRHRWAPSPSPLHQPTNESDDSIASAA